jgi:hypothetical protein
LFSARGNDVKSVSLKRVVRCGKDECMRTRGNEIKADRQLALSLESGRLRSEFESA